MSSGSKSKHETVRGAIEHVHTFRARCAGRSEKAFYVIATESGEIIWIPKSQILEPEEPFAEILEEEITIPHWLAKEKGLV